MNKMKWQNEIEMFCKIKPCIILEGNIYDKFRNLENGERLYELPDYLIQIFSKIGYENILVFDESQGFKIESQNDIDSKRINEIINKNGLEGISFTNSILPCSFSSSNENSKSEIGLVLQSILGQTKSASVIIMDMASRYIVSPDQMVLPDVNAYTSVLRAIRHSKFGKANQKITQESYLKNLVVLIVNKINDIPAWFYLSNPDVKSIQISTPDEKMRSEYISEENLHSFFYNEIWDNIKPITDDEKSKMKSIQKSFVGLTDGLTYSDLLSIKRLCKNEFTHWKQIPDVVTCYRHGIKENKWNSISKETVQELNNDLKKNIIGQDNAIEKVMDVIKRSVIQKSGTNRPKGILFFAGPTGTGKTETAKILAKNIFGEESCCIRFDMSEYRQEQSDQKLLGAPPGYVGYEAGGQLTNAIKNNPFSILLFDEIEKAHPSILDKFLQILDDGRITDGQGNTVYFSESIIIFTSNKGIIDQHDEIDSFGHIKSISKPIVSPNCDTFEQVQSKVVESIKDYFTLSLGRPELLNRIGENNIVVFDFIRPENNVVERILDKHIELCKKSIFEDLNISVIIEEKAYNKLLSKAQSDSILINGGRGIRNLVESSLLTPLTRYIFDYEVSEGQTVFINSIMFSDVGKIEIEAKVE